MSAGNELPRGYKAVDMTKLRGNIDNPSPLDASLRSLVVKDREIRSEKDGERKQKPPLAKVKSISDIVSNNIQASTDLRTITHYIKRAEQIWTTLLLKPNGDQKQLLIYDTESSDIKNSKLHELLIQKVENYFTTKYPFEEYIPQIIKDVLFRTGSYIHVNMSHAVLDHLINGMEIDGNEQFKDLTKNILAHQFTDENMSVAKNIGYIRQKPLDSNLSGFESLYGNVGKREPEYHVVHEKLNWTFTDNPLVLKMGALSQRIREDMLAKMAGMESFDSAITNVFSKRKGRRKVNNNNVGIGEKKKLEKELGKIYKERNYDVTESISVRKGKYYTGNGRGIGISFHWPSESGIPVHVNGEIGRPFGILLLTDPKTGEPLRNVGDLKYYQGTASSGDTATNKIGTMNDIISHIRTIADGKECNVDMKWMAEFSSATLEKELNEGFLNGDLQKDVTISLTEENKKLFLSRAIRDQGIRIVFVPSEYITYVATDFTSLGVGKSLVDEAKIHIGRLAVLQTADALAQIENSISHTLLEISPEAEDVDFRNTVALARDEYFAGNPTLHDILGYNNVSIDAILDRFKEQSLTIKVNPGDNPHAVAPDITASQMDREPLKSVDKDTIDSLLNTISGFFGVKRSWLEDTGEGNDFAIEALADQELLRNQTTDYSKTFSKFFTDIMVKNMRVNEPLITELLEVIKDNKGLYLKPDQTGTLEAEEKEEEVVIDKEEVEEENKKKGKKPKENKKDEKEEVVPVEDEDSEEFTDEELEDIEIVLKDFLNTFYVSLPTPAITESLVKLEDKLETVEKLVDFWTNLGGGSKLLKRRADSIGMNGDDIVDNVKAVLLNEAFERFNLPMPFEAILKKGKTGGLMQYISKATDLDANIITFLKEWYKEASKNDKKLDGLKDKIDTANNEDTGLDAGMSPAEEGDNPEAVFEDGAEPVETEEGMNTEEQQPTDENTEEENSEANTEVNEDTAPQEGDDLWSEGV